MKVRDELKRRAWSARRQQNTSSKSILNFLAKVTEALKMSVSAKFNHDVVRDLMKIKNAPALGFESSMPRGWL